MLDWDSSELELKVKLVFQEHVGQWVKELHETEGKDSQVGPTLEDTMFEQWSFWWDDAETSL